MTKEQIKKLAGDITDPNTKRGSLDLDEAVLDIFSGMASDINNCGVYDQVEFLVGQGVTEEEILKLK